MPYYIKKQREAPPIEVSDKHVALRAVIFFLALFVAVGSIAFGVSRIGHKEAGFYELTAAADAEMLLYPTGLHANFYFQGGSNEIKVAIGAADKVYTQALKEAYKLLDAEREYPGCVNLASFNAHLNEDLQVDPRLFAVLTDAYARTLEQKGYSLFAGPLYTEWEEILILTEPEDFDPLRNDYEAERLEQLRQLTGDLTLLRLAVVSEEEHILRLEAPADYLAALEELELKPTVMDLNILREAYLLELVAAELEEQELTQGYLSTDRGLTLALSGQTGGQYCLYGLQEGQVVQAAAAPVASGSACCMFTAFTLVSGESEFYVLEDGGKSHLRNPYLPADGLDRELLLSSCVIRADGDLVQACYESVCLRAAESAAELEKQAGESDSAVAWMLQKDETGSVRTNPAGGALFVA